MQKREAESFQDIILKEHSSRLTDPLTIEDLREIDILYWEVIKRYNQLSRLFGFNNPVQIYAMYNYLYPKGYLSADKSFFKDASHVREIPSFVASYIEGIEIMGANVINGAGACRHTAPMLRDILQDFGVTSFVLNCCLYDIRTKLIERVLGNHVICFAEDDNYSYFLESLLPGWYSLSEKNPRLLYGHLNDSPIDYCFETKIINIGGLLSFRKDAIAMRDKIRDFKPSFPSEEFLAIRKETIATFTENEDIFEQFYHDNKELYGEISRKLSKVGENPMLKYRK